MKPWQLFPIRSLGLRIALFSVLVSGAVLAVYISLTFAAIQRVSRMRMEDSIKEFAHKHLVEPRDMKRWDRVGDSLRFFLGDYEENAFILLIKDREGAVLFVTPNWPPELPVDRFPAADKWGTYGSPSPERKVVAPPDPLAGPPKGPPPRLKIPEFFTLETRETKWRIGKMGSADLTIVLGLNMRRQTEEMAPIRHALIMTLPIALLFIAAGAWWIAVRALRPIRSLTETIEGVKAKGLEQRVSAQDTDREFSRLIAVFNDMMEWIERTFHQAIRFTADASHELKTPLTVLQAQVEQAVHECETGSEEQQRYVAFGKELQRLKSITQKLLLLSRIDAGELKLNLRPLDLSQMVEGVLEDTEVLAPALKVEGELAPNLWVSADADLMKQVIQNLAANAVKFNHKGGYVRFKLSADDKRVMFSIANSGKGIAPDDRDKVFTRFYRGDKARTRGVSGAGLGLSLAREVIRAHQGELMLEPSTDGDTVFSLTLPRVTL